jgi:hypothetical protein
MRLIKRGGLRMRLHGGEAELLGKLLQELTAVVAADAAGDPVRERLFPAAYADDEAAAEYRELTEAGLREERVQRIQECAEDLATHAPDIPLADEAGDRWMRVLNDMRLALGTQLGVTEDWDHEVDPDDPDQLPHATYVWLTAVQDSLVRALM